jgi:hypothetical protein
MQIGLERAFSGGAVIELDTPAKIVNGRTFVPLRFVGEALGAKVDWDQASLSVVITETKAQ